MPKSKELVSTSESDSDSEPKQKKTKVEAKKDSKPKSSKGASSGTGDGELHELGRMRYVSATQFKGRKMVNIREYYDADGEMKPGRKGISLSEDQWKKLKSLVDTIDNDLEEL